MVRSGDRGGAREVFEFVKANHATYGVRTMCRVLGVTASGYYAWRHRPPSARQRDDALLTDELRRFHRLSHERYGRPKLCMDLAEAGYRVSAKRVARLMRAAGLYGVSRRRWPKTTVRDRDARPAPDLVERRFWASRPNELWVADITYVPTWAGFLYLAVVLDVCSRRIVGWAMANHLRAELVLDALEMALQQRRPQNVIHHSDSKNARASCSWAA